MNGYMSLWMVFVKCEPGDIHFSQILGHVEGDFAHHFQALPEDTKTYYCFLLSIHVLDFS